MLVPYMMLFHHHAPACTMPAALGSCRIGPPALCCAFLQCTASSAWLTVHPVCLLLPACPPCPNLPASTSPITTNCHQMPPIATKQIPAPTSATGLARGGDISAMLTAWPQLQSLQLAGVPAFSVGHTSWSGLSTLTCLTSLALQFVLPSATVQIVCRMSYSANSPLQGLCRAAMSPMGVGMPILQLDQLPAQLEELQLSRAFVCLPATGSMRLG